MEGHQFLLSAAYIAAKGIEGPAFKLCRFQAVYHIISVYYVCLAGTEKGDSILMNDVHHHFTVICMDI